MDLTIDNLYATDPELEVGTGLKIVFVEEKIWVQVRRAGGRNRRFNRVLAEKQRDHLTEIRAGTLDPEIEERLLMEAYAETVVIGWGGFTTAEGTELVCTPPNVLSKFIELPDFFHEIRARASQYQFFRQAQAEALAKNSSGGCEPTLPTSLTAAG